MDAVNKPFTMFSYSVPTLNKFLGRIYVAHLRVCWCFCIAEESWKQDIGDARTYNVSRRCAN